ncbi:unnamed protein product [Trichobilharzia szidati]|nr:unnamed protein product [Trichobilharzia szidati]
MWGVPYSSALFIFIVNVIQGAELPHGVPMSKSSFYQVGHPFTCLDGSSTISWWKVNDDYCDCRDGSDEPGTSACLNGRFSCRDLQYRPVLLPSAYVNDSVCDCCDGSDEYGDVERCPSTCGALEASLREARSVKRNQLEQGHKIFREYVENLKERKAKGLFEEVKPTEQHDSHHNLQLETSRDENPLPSNEDSAQPHLSNNDNNNNNNNNNDNKEHATQAVEQQPKHNNEENELSEPHHDDEHHFDLEEPDQQHHYDEDDHHDEQNDDSRHDPEALPSHEEPIDSQLKPIPVSIDYGPEEGFRMLTELPDGCLEVDDREYTYSLCAFKSVHQRPLGSSKSDVGTCIGRWGRWLEGDTNEKSYEVMYYENGMSCWNGPTRSTKVFVHCGDTNKITSVSEPSRCEYVMQLITPAACSEDPDQLFKRLHPEL